MFTPLLPFDVLPPPARPATAPGRALAIGGTTYRVEIARHRWARRYVLRLTGDDTLRLTVPRGASIAGGLKFAERQGDWITREKGRQRERVEPWRNETTIWYRGERVTLRVDRGVVTLAGETMRLKAGAGDVRAAVEAHLTELAKRELPPRAGELARAHGLEVKRWSVRNQRSRWGSCSPSRVITLNWRLVQMPASVSDYVILHELMHLRQANHSRRFWREVEKVCASWREAERWLRRHGREIL